MEQARNGESGRFPTVQSYSKCCAMVCQLRCVGRCDGDIPGRHERARGGRSRVARIGHRPVQPAKCWPVGAGFAVTVEGHPRIVAPEFMPP